MLSYNDLFVLWVDLEARFPAGRRNVWPYLSMHYRAGYAATRRLMQQCVDAGIFTADLSWWTEPGWVEFPETATRSRPHGQQMPPLLLATGFIYAPYVPLMVTPLVQHNDFIPRRGVMTRYASHT